MPTLTIELALAVVTVGGTRAVIAALATAAGLLVLAASRRAVWQTTLISSWWWSLAAVASWGAVECWHALQPAAFQTPAGDGLRLAAMTLSLCPAVALMGAKRPQDRAWNFVVLALLAVLILPIAETLLLQPGQRPTFRGARSWFLWAPILLGLASYLPTRYALGISLIATGQVVALSPYLALLGRPQGSNSTLTGLVGVALGLVIVWARHGSCSPQRDAQDNQRDSQDKLWIDFRNSFGLFWALRVQERMNAMARQQQWRATLFWHGFQADPDAAATDSPAAEIRLQSTFRGLLRRFVSSEWLLDRAPRKPPQPAEVEAA